jgi:isopenicillin N synthase-like dioxygenase
MSNKENCKKYYCSHKEQFKERNRKYYQSHREERKAYSREYRRTHRGYFKGYWLMNKKENNARRREQWHMTRSRQATPERRKAMIPLSVLISVQRHTHTLRGIIKDVNQIKYASR